MVEWRTIPQYPNYRVSTDGDIENVLSGKRLKPARHGGYHGVVLCDETGHHYNSVHRIVASTFIPNPEGKSEVNHKDGNKRNNRLDNLEWATRSENMKHAYKSGLCIPNATQIEESLAKSHQAHRKKIVNIRTNVIYESITQCALHEGLSRSAVSMELTGRTNMHRFAYAD